jgi:hypothetical protein
MVKILTATIKYHWIQIQAKDFVGGLSILTRKGPNKKLGNNTLATTEPQSHRATYQHQLQCKAFPMVKM